MSAKESLMHVAQDAKVGHAIATATAGTGAGTLLDLIPDEIGKLATLVGIVLSSVLIFVHLSTYRTRRAKDRLELEILREQRERQLRGED